MVFAATAIHYLPAGSSRHTVRSMRSKESPGRKSLFSLSFVGATTVSSLVMGLVCTFAPIEAQIGVLGAFVSILGGLFLSYLEQEAERERRRAELIERLTIPLSLANDHDIYLQYQAICKTLADLTKQTDPILREIAGLKLASIVDQLAPLADGMALFSGTEGWRTVYEKLLQSPDLKEYQSVAWVRTKDYWQDAPGRQSMEANFAAINRGVRIERILILREDIWPKDQILPLGDIGVWIENQHNHGVWVVLARESDLIAEPGLLVDMGIYGTRAVGTQELDERCRTLRFSLTFDPQSVRLAKDRWDRLYLFSTSFQSLLDRAPTDA